METSATNLAMLRHAVATLAYRGSKVLAGVPPEFESFRAAPTTRTPGEILAHIGDLLDWALVMADGRHEWHDSKPVGWERQVERFFAGLQAFDRRLASDAPPREPPEKLFQGPVADALTHVGQLAMLRRMAGSPVRGENYFVAKIETGRVGPNQESPLREFD